MNIGQNIQVVKKKRGRRPTPRGELDRKVARELGDFIIALANEYDLSTETARAKSHGSKRFRTHKLTNNHGLAKLGGLIASKQCQIDRYVSYRVADVNLSLCGWLSPDVTLDQIRFQVFGPKSDFENPLSWNVLRPNVTVEMSDRFGEEHLDIEGAKAKFKSLVERYADRK
jgi:hypothetical protein